jgi:hypothetical protein
VKHIVCYSKGNQSGLVAVEVVRRYGPENVILLNHNINAKKELPEVKRFGLELAAYLGIPITYANMLGWDTKSQFDVCVEAKAFKVGAGHPLCTNRLKTEPFYEWLEEFYPVEKGTCRSDVTIYYGFGNEPDRINRRRKHLNDMGYKVEFPLIEWPRTIRSTLEIGIKPSETYQTWRHANCIGCLRAGWQHWYCVYCLYPEIWQEAMAAEEQIGYSILKRNNVPTFLHERVWEFEMMRRAGIPANEITPSSRFWRLTDKVMNGRLTADKAEWILPDQMDLLDSEGWHCELEEAT